MSEHIEPYFPRLFTPPIIQDISEYNNLDTSMLKTYIKKQQDIIDRQAIIIKEYENEINNLKIDVSEIKHLLRGRQFMTRSVSFENNDHNTN